MRRIRQHRRGERGQAGLELVGMLPVLVLGALMLLQFAAAMWTITSTNEAARNAARAYSRDPGVDLDGARTVAENSLPGALDVKEFADAGRGGHGIRLTVEIPSVIILDLPEVTREVVMP
jgi:hypothetical protein